MTWPLISLLQWPSLNKLHQKLFPCLNVFKEFLFIAGINTWKPKMDTAFYIFSKMKSLQPIRWIRQIGQKHPDKFNNSLQGLFVPFACVGSGDPHQIHCVQLKHLLPMTMYNLSLPKLMCCSTAGCLWLCNYGLLHGLTPNECLVLFSTLLK